MAFGWVRIGTVVRLSNRYGVRYFNWNRIGVSYRYRLRYTDRD